MSDGNGQTTFLGPGFGTLRRSSASGASGGPPPVVSRRGYLRRGTAGDLPRRRTSRCASSAAFEGVLDPIAAMLDALPEHFSPGLRAAGAARPAVGVARRRDRRGAGTRRASRDRAHGRRARPPARYGARPGARAAAELPRRPDARRGRGRRALVDGRRARATVDPARFVVYVDVPIPEDRQVAIARCIDHHKPVQATYRLRIKATKKASE